MINDNQWTLWKFYVITTVIWHTFWQITVNIFMWIIYHIELPFFERYKINSEPWPWYQNPAEWRELLKKSILLVSFNGLVSLPILLIASLAITNYDV